MTPDTFVEAAHPLEQLTELLDGRLTGAELEAVNAHLAACASCAALHAKASLGAHAARGLGQAHAPTNFAARIMKRVRRDRHGLRHGGGLDQKVPFEGTIIVLIVAAAAAVLLGYEVHAHGGLFARNDPPMAQQKR